jgi:hypothetical protein
LVSSRGPRGVGVEPADGDDAGRVADEPDHGRPALRVARGRDDPGRLVEQHVGQPLLRHTATVDLDLVAVGDERAQRADLAVDADATLLDQLVGAAA